MGMMCVGVHVHVCVQVHTCYSMPIEVMGQPWVPVCNFSLVEAVTFVLPLHYTKLAALQTSVVSRVSASHLTIAVLRLQM